jgi:50S ribosomal subunit-associated GTPase HflX
MDDCRDIFQSYLDFNYFRAPYPTDNGIFLQFACQFDKQFNEYMKELKVLCENLYYKWMYMFFVEKHFVDKLFLITEGASNVRVRAKGIELVILNRPAEELKGSQEFKASRKVCRRNLFRRKTWNS